MGAVVVGHDGPVAVGRGFGEAGFERGCDPVEQAVAVEGPGAVVGVVVVEGGVVERAGGEGACACASGGFAEFGEGFVDAAACEDTVGDGGFGAGEYDAGVTGDLPGLADDDTEQSVVVDDASVDALFDGAHDEQVANVRDLGTTDPVDTSDALLESHEVPRQVVVDQ